MHHAIMSDSVDMLNLLLNISVEKEDGGYLQAALVYSAVQVEHGCPPIIRLVHYRTPNAHLLLAALIEFFQRCTDGDTKLTDLIDTPCGRDCRVLNGVERTALQELAVFVRRDCKVQPPSDSVLQMLEMLVAHGADLNRKEPSTGLCAREMLAAAASAWNDSAASKRVRLLIRQE